MGGPDIDPECLGRVYDKDVVSTTKMTPVADARSHRAGLSCLATWQQRTLHACFVGIARIDVFAGQRADKRAEIVWAGTGLLGLVWALPWHKDR